MASRGEYGAALGQRNRDKVQRFFALNPWGTQRECAAETGLSPEAVNRHCKVLKAEYEAQRTRAEA
jgi:AraC-like DNA-binding protein